MSTNEWVIFALAAAGSILLLVGAIGILRFDHVLARMHASGVGGTLGIALVLLSAGLFYYRSDQFWRMVVLVVLFFMTSPIATTAMARAAYRIGSPKSVASLIHDDMADPDYHSNSEPAPKKGDPSSAA